MVNGSGHDKFETAWVDLLESGHKAGIILKKIHTRKTTVQIFSRFVPAWRKFLGSIGANFTMTENKIKGTTKIEISKKDPPPGGAAA